MKIISQLGIVFGICLFSKVVEVLLPFSFPASVIGLLVLLALLGSGLLKRGSIREAADFLTGNLTFLLVPIVVSIMNYIDLLKATLLPFFLTCIISTLVTFFAVYYTVHFTAKWLKDKQEGKDA